MREDILIKIIMGAPGNLFATGCNKFAELCHRIWANRRISSARRDIFHPLRNYAFLERPGGEIHFHTNKRGLISLFGCYCGFIFPSDNIKMNTKSKDDAVGANFIVDERYVIWWVNGGTDEKNRMAVLSTLAITTRDKSQN